MTINRRVAIAEAYPISNLTLPEILENYGERIFSRLAAMQLVKFDFEASGDLRLRLK